VLPIDDYGIRKGFARIYGHKEVPKPKAVLEHGERWRPYRSIASWYLWRAAEEKQKKPERPKKARKASASQ
jgi:DNA-3-methyladenine glycosylase II